MNTTADNAMITVEIPPWLITPITQALNAEGIPYYLAGRTLTVSAVAQPILDMLLPQQRSAGAGFDLLCRQPVNRSRSTDAMGFVLALLVVGGVIASPLGLVPPGVDPEIGRGVVILVGGVVVTVLISQFVVGNDPRRWMFVAGMIGLFLAAAAWFVAQGMGVL